MSKIDYHVQFLDNGIVMACPDYDFLECKEYSERGDNNDKAAINFIGRTFWEDIREAANELLANNLEITLTIEEDKQ